MAEAGRLRLRDDRLVVEALDGRVLAEVEPDHHMSIDSSGLLAASFVAPDVAGELEGRISVSWFQTVTADRGHIDGEAEDITELEEGEPHA